MPTVSTTYSIDSSQIGNKYSRVGQADNKRGVAQANSLGRRQASNNSDSKRTVIGREEAGQMTDRRWAEIRLKLSFGLPSCFGWSGILLADYHWSNAIPVKIANWPHFYSPTLDSGT
jgi:hypothetical protein